MNQKLSVIKPKTDLGSKKLLKLNGIFEMNPSQLDVVL